MAISVFYGPILPLGVLISFFGLIITYLIEKYNVLYHYRRPEKIDGQITRAYIELHRTLIFVHAISVYIFLGGIYPEDTNWELISIILFGTLILVPYGSVLKIVGYFDVSAVTNNTYEDLYFEIGMNYEMANPLTKNKGFERYLYKLRECNVINDEEYTDHITRIKSAPSDVIELYYKKKYGKAKKDRTDKLKGLLKNLDAYDNGENKNEKFLKRFRTKKIDFFGKDFNEKSKPNFNFENLVKNQGNNQNDNDKNNFKDMYTNNNLNLVNNNNPNLVNNNNNNVNNNNNFNNNFNNNNNNFNNINHENSSNNRIINNNFPNEAIINNNNNNNNPKENKNSFVNPMGDDRPVYE